MDIHSSSKKTTGDYLNIEDYGLIGDLHSVALVGINGSIDWFCFPHFDSPSVFGGILDSRKGGYFRVHAKHRQQRTKQLYWPDTNILITRFLAEGGVGELIDFMPINNGEISNLRRIIRRLEVVRGCVPFQLECYPAFNYGQDRHKSSISNHGVCFYSDKLSLGLASPVPLVEHDNGVSSEFVLHEGQSATFTLSALDKAGQCPLPLSEKEAVQLFNETVAYWKNWISQCNYKGRWREMVQRSAFTLKLLTFEPTGAIVAAPTCSLPEVIGGERNWDYRYTWLRDAAFTVYAFLRIGFIDEAKNFMKWVEARCGELNEDGSLQIMYGIDGRHDLTERTLDHLEGYKGSNPVRIGNGAYNQLQLDIYGELMDAVYLYDKHGLPISYDFWSHLRRLVEWVCSNWKRTDEGVWEVRGGQKEFVYSKLMCWVALDRAIRLSDKRSFPTDRVRWLKIRNEIYEDIMKKGWNEELKIFVQSYGSTTLDAANLMMPLTFFVSPSDPRILQTLNATLKSPKEGGLFSNGLVYRYDVSETDDGLSGEEGTFNICTFWLVEALARAGKSDRSYLDKARLMFEKMLGFANHVGLYAEETGFRGEGLGNYPQAFTHLALISAAYNLNRALEEQ